MSKEITNNQKEFIISFFKDERYAGWKNIATALIENGKCIVPGSECIWKGGIGNFIATKETDLAVGCLEYSFDLSVFLSSAWFEEVKYGNLIEIRAEEEKLEKELKTIQEKFNEISML